MRTHRFMNNGFRVDCMMISWILNSISKDIVEAFLYITSSKELWQELKKTFDRCNDPLLYQLQREISSISQKDLPCYNVILRLRSCGMSFIVSCLFLTVLVVLPNLF